MPDDWFDGDGAGGPPGAYEQGGVTGGAGGAVFYPSDTNPAGAESDPFAYTNGSLLTPWSGHFDSSKYAVGGGPAAYKPFQFGDFSYQAPNVGTFQERYDNPGDFKYGDYVAPGAFKAPNAADMRRDPGYQARLDAGQKALLASKAAQGVLKTGGTAKAIQRQGQTDASQEYGNVYNRKLGEYNMGVEQGRFAYGTNRSNNAENYDRNVSNQRQGYQIRQGAFKDNAAIGLQQGQLGYDVAQGTYDRNLSLHRQQYDDERQYANAVAAAGASGANQAYGRALDDYTRSRDEFWTNQDRQYSILDREANRGYGAASDYANTSAGLATDRGNAQASGTVGSANAWTGALGSIGQYAGDAALYYGTRGSNAPKTAQRPSGYSTPPYAGPYQLPRGSNEAQY